MIVEKEKLFLLRRKISSYTGVDLFLGIFNDFQFAEMQREKYIQKCKKKDKWKDQAYTKVDLNTDVIIEDISNKIELTSPLMKSQKLFVIGEYSEMLGQIDKKLILISLSEKEVKKWIERKDEDDNIMEYYKYEIIELNNSYFEK